MDRVPNRRSNTPFSNSSSVVWMEPQVDFSLFSSEIQFEISSLCLKRKLFLFIYLFIFSAECTIGMV